MTTNEMKKCLACDSMFQPSGEWDSICDPCAEKLDEERAERQRLEIERKIAENLAIIRQRVANATPALFRATDTKHPKFNGTAWAKIKEHRFTANQPWLGLVGTTGRCKSRLAYLFAAQELERLTDTTLPSFELIASYEIGELVQRLHGDDWSDKAKARAYLDKLRRVDLILIDDLGKGRATPAVAAELFALIDFRHSHQLRTIWTSNSSPEAIAAGMPEDMAGPFAGRINESSKIFNFR